jgi:dimethylargininase
MRGVFTKAIVRPPSRNFAAGLTTAELGAPDYHLALEQHAAYCAALELCGLQLIKLEADERYPDACFVEDAAIVFDALPHGRATAPDAALIIEDSSADYADYADSKSHDPRDARKQAILTRPGAPSRQGEVASIRSELSGLFPALDEIGSPGTVDGGDICEAGTHFFIGISQRTNEEGARQLVAILTKHGFTSSFVDIRNQTHPQDARTTSLLHLKSGLAYIGNKTLAVTEALAKREEFRGYRLVHVDPSEDYATNCIEVNGRVLIAAGHPRFAAKLRDLGYETIALEMSEFQKMDGGLSCLSLRW